MTGRVRRSHRSFTNRFSFKEVPLRIYLRVVLFDHLHRSKCSCTPRLELPPGPGDVRRGSLKHFLDLRGSPRVEPLVTRLGRSTDNVSQPGYLMSHKITFDLESVLFLSPGLNSRVTRLQSDHGLVLNTSSALTASRIFNPGKNCSDVVDWSRDTINIVWCTGEGRRAC